MRRYELLHNEDAGLWIIIVRTLEQPTPWRIHSNWPTEEIAQEVADALNEFHKVPRLDN